MNTRYCIATPTADLFDSISCLAAASGLPTNSKFSTRRERRLVAPKGAGVRSSETLATVRCLISACTRLPSRVVHCNRCLHTTTYNVSTANAERRAGLKVGAHTKALSVSVSSVVSKRLYGCSRGLVCRVATGGRATRGARTTGTGSRPDVTTGTFTRANTKLICRRASVSQESIPRASQGHHCKRGDTQTSACEPRGAEA